MSAYLFRWAVLEEAAIALFVQPVVFSSTITFRSFSLLSEYLLLIPFICLHHVSQLLSSSDSSGMSHCLRALFFLTNWVEHVLVQHI